MRWAEQATEADGQSPARHHRLLLDALARIADGKIDRLMLLLPPGHGKSTYGSVIFPAWWFSRHPTSSVIAACHTADLAAHFARRVRGLVLVTGQTQMYALLATTVN